SRVAEVRVVHHVRANERAVAADGVELQRALAVRKDLDELPGRLGLLRLRADVPGSAAQLRRPLAVLALREQDRANDHRLLVLDRLLDVEDVERTALEDRELAGGHQVDGGALERAR